jgi:hypothetical protein
LQFLPQTHEPRFYQLSALSSVKAALDVVKNVVLT